MNAFLDRIAKLYAPLGQRGLLMDGQYRFAPDRPTGKAEPRRSARPVGARPQRGLLRKTRWHAY
jgi:hypothetical protein